MTTTFTCDLTSPTWPLPHFREHTIGAGHFTLMLRADDQAQMARNDRDIMRTKEEEARRQAGPGPMPQGVDQ